MESKQGEQTKKKKKEKKKKNNNYKSTSRELSNIIKQNNIHIIGIPEGERGKGTENLFEEIIAENFPNLGMEADIQIQEAQRATNKINPRRSTPRNVIKWQID